MVNTRRTGGTPADKSENLRNTRKGATLEGSSSISDRDSEDSQPEDNFSNSNDKRNLRSKKKLALPRVRELRSRFAYSEYSSHRRGSKEVTSRRERNLYTSRKMRDDSDSSSNAYSYGRRSHRSLRRSNINRIERRTRLSLRPISRKSYADPHSPLAFNSDDGAKVYPERKRTVRFKNTSWLADDQMHKVGYPNLNPIAYSEEDSQDIPENNDAPEGIKPPTRQSNNKRETNKSNYSYNYDDSDQNQNNNPRIETNSKELRNKNSIDKEKDTCSGVRRLRSSIKIENEEETNDNLNNQEESSKIDNDESNKPEVKEKEGEKLATNKDSSDSDAPLQLRRTSRQTNRKPFRLPPSRLRRKANCESSDSSDEEKNTRKKISTSDDDNRRPYSLRHRPPKPPPDLRKDFTMPETSRKRHFRRRRRSSSSSSDSSSDDSRKYKQVPKSPHSKNEQRMKRKNIAGGSAIIPIGPETLDGTVRFSSIGGLDNHIQCLKEIVLLPMMYPEVFQQFSVKPPKGVLFHGPPGTGKTLIARALANECSFGTRKVSFFMRKGADLLSKWIGESEKQLRLLFEQAAELKPSIIFFDELDGLIPVRSSRNDQIHASIVSTLLALMDGLNDRGEIIIIGATNRVDAIDPAFRRPGRFDRELYFPLPARQEREDILSVHVSKWENPPDSMLMKYLAEQAVGYCGSDLRALCTEAVIQSFRRTYPQVYESEHKLLLKPEEVNVNRLDFMRAKSVLVPASHRVNKSCGRKLLPILEPLLGSYMEDIFKMLETTFPHGVHEKLARVKLSANIRPAQLLLVGEGSDHGHTKHLGPAIIYKMEHLQCNTLDLSTLYNESSSSTEEATLRVFTEAKRNIPSVIYIPCIDKFWNILTETTKAIILDQLSQLDPHMPILLFASADVSYDELPEDVQSLFSTYRKEVFEIASPTGEQRKEFFKPLIINSSLKPVRLPRERPKTPPVLPKAPTPPPTPLTERELKNLYEKEEHTLRELRIFLRDMCRKLAQNKMFFMFTKPVDIEEVPDYPTIITQPMDLETMMMKVDFHRYECAKDFLADIELIVHNALEYNPAKTSVDKQIRHRACSLKDYAYTLIKTEMDSDFEDKCQDISRSRKTRQIKVHLPEYLITPEIANLDNFKENNTNVDKKTDEPQTSTKVTHSAKKRRVGSWQKGLLKPAKKRKKDKSPENSEDKADKSSDNESKDNNPEVDGTQSDTSKEEENKILVNGKESTEDKNSNVNLLSTPSKPKNETGCWQSPKRRLSDLMSPSELLDDLLYFDDVDQAMNESNEINSTNVNDIECSMDDLELTLKEIIEGTEGCTLHSLLDLHNQFSKIINRYLRTHKRTNLHQDLLNELNRFKNDNLDISIDPTKSNR